MRHGNTTSSSTLSSRPSNDAGLMCCCNGKTLREPMQRGFSNTTANNSALLTTTFRELPPSLPGRCFPPSTSPASRSKNSESQLWSGVAGTGYLCKLIASVIQDAGLSSQDTFGRFYALDRYGLLVEGTQGIRPEQAAFVRKRTDVAGWQCDNPKEIGLLDVVRNVKPTVLIGVSGQPGAFTEEAIRLMASRIPLDLSSFLFPTQPLAAKRPRNRLSIGRMASCPDWHRQPASGQPRFKTRSSMSIRRTIPIFSPDWLSEFFPSAPATFPMA